MKPVISLYDYQRDAVERMKNGCILVGGVGSGKSRTSLAYYYKEQGGDLDSENFTRVKNAKNLYIITTAQKRDSLEWEKELIPFLLSTDLDLCLWKCKVYIDSWNNIGKYAQVRDSFFIFDEQRVCGSGAWVKSFLKIAKSNDWILLSATPGDVWSDFIPVFIANGFYRNKTDFTSQHVIYSRFTKYPKIDRYVNTKKLLYLRDSILVDMDFQRETKAHHEDCYVDYNHVLYKTIMRDRWNPWENRPIINASELAHSLRRVVNTDETRQTKLLEILEDHPRAIIFYNFNHELDILKNLYYGEGVEIAEYNGFRHDPLPKGDKWVYLVNYAAGNAGWNCITTDTIIFYSQNYSYKVMQQAAGRIDRLNTPYKNLYYYHLKTRSGIDLAISKALSTKKTFNETKYFAKIAKSFMTKEVK